MNKVVFLFVLLSLSSNASSQFARQSAELGKMFCCDSTVAAYRIKVIYGGENATERAKYSRLASCAIKTLMEKDTTFSAINSSIKEYAKEQLKELMTKWERISWGKDIRVIETIITYNDDFPEVRSIPMKFTSKEGETKIMKLAVAFDAYDLIYVRFDNPARYYRR